MIHIPISTDTLSESDIMELLDIDAPLQTVVLHEFSTFHYLSESSLHWCWAAKQAMAQIFISTPVWNCLPLISHTPCCGTAWNLFCRDSRKEDKMRKIAWWWWRMRKNGRGVGQSNSLTKYNEVTVTIKGSVPLWHQATDSTSATKVLQYLENTVKGVEREQGKPCLPWCSENPCNWNEFDYLNTKIHEPKVKETDETFYGKKWEKFGNLPDSQ